MRAQCTVFSNFKLSITTIISELNQKMVNEWRNVLHYVNSFAVCLFYPIRFLNLNFLTVNLPHHISLYTTANQP